MIKNYLKFLLPSLLLILTGCELLERLEFIGDLIRRTGGVVAKGSARARTSSGSLLREWSILARVDMVSMNNISRNQDSGRTARNTPIQPPRYQTVTEPDCAIPTRGCPPPQQILVSPATQAQEERRRQFLSSATENTPPDLFWDRIFSMSLIPKTLPPASNGTVPLTAFVAYFVPKTESSPSSFLDSDPLGYEIYIFQCNFSVSSFQSEDQRNRMLASPDFFSTCGHRLTTEGMNQLRLSYNRNLDLIRTEVNDYGHLINFLSVDETASRWQELQSEDPYDSRTLGFFSVRRIVSGAVGAHWSPSSQTARTSSADNFSGSLRLRSHVNETFSRLFQNGLYDSLVFADLTTTIDPSNHQKNKSLNLIFSETDLFIRIYRYWQSLIGDAVRANHFDEARSIIERERQRMPEPWTLFDTEFHLESPELGRQIPHLEMLVNTGLMGLGIAAAHAYSRD